MTWEAGVLGVLEPTLERITNRAELLGASSAGLQRLTSTAEIREEG